MTAPIEELAVSDRRRLDVLLQVGRDPALQTSDPDPFPGEGTPEWAAGFSDRTAGVQVTVWFVPDQRTRDEAANRLSDEQGLVGTNGALLFFGHVTDGPGDAGSTPDAVARLDELGTRFGGEE